MQVTSSWTGRSDKGSHEWGAGACPRDLQHTQVGVIRVD